MKDTKKKSKVTKILTTASLNDLVQIQKWWEKPPEEDNDKSDDEEETKKWKHMEHNGVLFAAEYEPHHIKIKYKGEPIELTPEQEEVATFWGTVVGSDFEKRVIAQKNFINVKCFTSSMVFPYRSSRYPSSIYNHHTQDFLYPVLSAAS